MISALPEADPEAKVGIELGEFFPADGTGFSGRGIGQRFRDGEPGP